MSATPSEGSGLLRGEGPHVHGRLLGTCLVGDANSTFCCARFSSGGWATRRTCSTDCRRSRPTRSNIAAPATAINPGSKTTTGLAPRTRSSRRTSSSVPPRASAPSTEPAGAESDADPSTLPQTCALKCLSKRGIVDSGLPPHVVSEKEVTAKLYRPFVLKLHGAVQDDHTAYFLLEIPVGGDLPLWGSPGRETNVGTDIKKDHFAQERLVLAYILVRMISETKSR